MKKRDAKHPDSYTLVDKQHAAQIKEGIQMALKLSKETKVKLPYGARSEIHLVGQSLRDTPRSEASVGRRRPSFAVPVRHLRLCIFAR
jgi:hypothetical protein